MQSAHVIKKALLSEKAYKLMERGIYTFLVDDRANKDEIGNAINKQFGVKVKKVNILKYAAKSKRIMFTRKTALVGGGKKALVFLEGGQTIPLLSPKTESKKSKSKDKGEEKKGANLKEDK